MSTDFQYDVATSDDTDYLSKNAAWAFGLAAADMPAALERMKYENVRVVRRGGVPVGQLTLIRMGQYFGGRPVPLAGVVAVAVSPDDRGHGTATWMMSRAMEEMRAAGLPLSGLYPATQPVYRAVGFERAGCRYEVKIDSNLIDLKDRGLDLAPIAEADHGAIAAVYAEKARRNPGHLDRGEYMWNRVWKPKGEPPRGYKVLNGDRIEGYVVLTKLPPKEGIRSDFMALDLAALTPAAGRRLLTLFADHRSLAADFIWFGAPHDPLLHLLREQPARVRHYFTWMIRILDLTAALQQRGWPDGLSAELHLHVEDDLFADNHGDFVLRLSGGSATVERGGRGTFRTSIRGLAPIYTGHVTPDQAFEAGWLDAPPADRAAATAIFAGPQPWMPDMY